MNGVKVTPQAKDLRLRAGYQQPDGEKGSIVPRCSIMGYARHETKSGPCFRAGKFSWRPPGFLLHPAARERFFSVRGLVNRVQLPI